MLYEAARNVRVTIILDVVEVVISSGDKWALPHHRDGVGSGTRFEDLEVTSCRWWPYKMSNELRRGPGGGGGGGGGG